MYFISTDELVSFDFHNEVFGVVPIPSCLRERRMWNILDFKGSVAIVFISAGDGLVYDCFSLWEMTNICGEVSWRKRFTCKAASEIDRVSIYLSTGQFVASKGSGRLILYDYKKKETMNFQHSDLDSIYAVISHTESLASIKGFTQVQYQDRNNNQERLC